MRRWFKVLTGLVFIINTVTSVSGCGEKKNFDIWNLNTWGIKQQEEINRMFKPSYETPNEATMKDNWGNPKPRESIPWTSLKDQIVPVWNYYYYDYDFRDDLNNAFNQVNKDIHFDGVSDYNVVMTYESPIKIDKTTLASAVLKAGVEIFVKGEPNTVMTGDWKMILKH